jgi:hypothetical protein
MGRLDREQIARLKAHFARTPEQRARLEDAAVGWGDTPPPMSLLQRKKRRCMVCTKAIEAEQWPIGLHYCGCNKWHSVCAFCVRHYSMIERPYSGSWDYQKLDLCVRPVRAARKFMK